MPKTDNEISKTQSRKSQLHIFSMERVAVAFSLLQMKFSVIITGNHIFSDFVKGKSEPLPKIDEVGCRHLLKKSVAAMLAHTGYDGKC